MIDDDSMMMIMVQYRAIVRSGDDEHENQNQPIENNQRFDASQLKGKGLLVRVPVELSQRSLVAIGPIGPCAEMA